MEAEMEMEIKEIRIMLKEIGKEAEELVANIPVLLEELDKIKTVEDAKNWNDLCTKLILEFRHLDVSN